MYRKTTAAILLAGLGLGLAGCNPYSPGQRAVGGGQGAAIGALGGGALGAVGGAATTPTPPPPAGYYYR